MQQLSSGKKLVHPVMRMADDMSGYVISGQGFIVELNSISAHSVAYNVESIHPPTSIISPHKGVIPPKKSFYLAVTTNDNKESMQQCQLRLVLLSWPDDVQYFDQEIWNLLDNNKQTERQIISFHGCPSVGVEDYPGSYTESLKSIGLDQPLSQVFMPYINPRPPFWCSKPAIVKEWNNGPPVQNIVTSARLKSEPKISSLLHVNPMRLLYPSPYGSVERLAKTINVKCMHSREVAFKIQADLETWKIYSIDPSNGIIHPGDTTSINLIMKENFEPNEEEADKEAQAFHLFALEWPRSVDHFDAKLWVELEKTITSNMCTISVIVEMDKTKNDSEQPNPLQDVANNLNRATAGQELFSIFPKKLAHNLNNLDVQKAQLHLNIRSIIPTPIVFKVQLNRREYYTVVPCKGIIMPGKSVQVIMEMKENMTPRKLLSLPRPAKFNVIGMVWPFSSSSIISAKMWNQCEKMEMNIQNKMLQVVFDHGREQFSDESGGCHKFRTNAHETEDK